MAAGPAGANPRVPGREEAHAERWRAWAWPPLAYLALAVALTWPLALHLNDALPDLGDPQLLTWLLGWDAHALRSNPAAIWQAPIFYPYPDALAFSDSMLPLAVAIAPLIWLGGSAVLAFNLLLLLSFALAGWSVYGLALDITARRWPAFIAGAAFAFCTFRYGQLVHLQVLQTAWLPWALLFLRRLLRPSAAGGGRWRDALLFGIFAALQSTIALYYAFFAALVLGLYALLWALAALWDRLRRGKALPWRTLGRLLAGGALAAAIVVPLTLPYLRVYRTLGIVRSIRELDNWSAPLPAYVSVAQGNLLYGRLLPQLVGPGELVLFPGLVVGALALLGLAGGLRRMREPAWRESIFWLLVGLAGFVLSLGTGVRLERGGPALPIPLPYTLLYSYVPGFGALRVPARWGVLVSLSACVLAGIALARVLPHGPRSGRITWPAHALPALLLAVVLIEHVALPLSTTAPGLVSQAPPIYDWLGAPAQRDIGVVLELPIGKTPRGQELQRITWRQFYQMRHWKTLPVSYSGLIPFGTLDLLGIVQRLPDESALRYLQIVGVDTLVIHRDQAEPDALARLLAGLDSSPRARRRAEVGDALVYTLLPDGAIDGLPAGPGASVYVSADERVPGMLALALERRWRAGGLALYGPARLRYYGALGAPRPGQVFDFGLLAEGENPARYGFTAAGARWRSNGLALYAGDPGLRANLELGREPAGEFHRAFPAALDVTVRSTGVRAGDVEAAWSATIDRAYLELDVASLDAQTLQIGDTAYPVAPGASTIAAAVPLDRAVRVSGTTGRLALLRVRVRATPAAVEIEPRVLAVSADTRFSGSRLSVRAQVGGEGAVLLEVRGAAAYDDRPILLLAGSQPTRANGGALAFETDLLAPNAPWLTHAEPSQDGRYIAYLKDAARPDMPGVPVAQFTIRGGALADPDPVPLPLTALR